MTQKNVSLKSVLILTSVATLLTFVTILLSLFSNYFISVQTINWLKLSVSIFYGLILLAEVAVFSYATIGSIKLIKHAPKSNRKFNTLFVVNLINLFFFLPLTVIMMTILKNILV